MSAIDEFGAAAAAVLAAVSPSLVSIGQDGRGTGLVVGPGKVLTNAHNLRDRTTTVSFADGRRAQAALAGSDADGDLVVVHPEPVDGDLVDRLLLGIVGVGAHPKGAARYGHHLEGCAGAWHGGLVIGHICLRLVLVAFHDQGMNGLD